jgi:MYXO-CTERM domain-containing protein
MMSAPARRVLGPLVAIAALAGAPSRGHARTLLRADGPGGTYELIRPLYGTEVPDCGHMVPHITEEMDSELRKPVFVFHAHVNQDDDRCGSQDRQRTEIRGHVTELEGINGGTSYYRWKFKLPTGFQSASSFTHIMQIKSGQAAPIMTLTPRSGNLSIDGRVGVRGTTALAKFLGVWVVADMRIRYANAGRIELTIRRLDNGETLFQHTGDADTWDDGAGGHDPKWGIYRSLNDRGSLRDEQIRFADFCVSHTSASECDEGAVTGTDGGAPPPPTDSGSPAADASAPPPPPPAPAPDAGPPPPPSPPPPAPAPTPTPVPPATDPVPPPAPEVGCGCRVGDTGGGPSGFGLLLLATMLGLVSRRRKLAGVALLGAIFLVGACSGEIQSSAGGTPGRTGEPDPGAPSGAGALPPASDPGCTAAGTAADSGPSPLRRLTRAEYLRTVTDLFGTPPPDDLNLPDEEVALGFRNSAEGRAVSEVLVGRWVTAAEKLSVAAVGRLPALLSCDPGRDGESACLDRFLDGFARRAWRRPLEPQERDNLERAFAEGKAASAGAFGDGLQSVIQVLLLSPQFLYRVERGAGPGKLTPWETASRLSYLLWGSMPDDQLLAAAEAGRLSTAAQVEAQAERLLADPRAAEMLTGFADQWLHLEEIASLEKDADLYPTFQPELRASLRGETQQLIAEVVWKAGVATGRGQLATLLSAPFTYVDAPLARYYGWPAVPATGFHRVTLPAGQRAGVLTHAGVLALLGVADDSLNSLVFRGRFVRERLLCQDVPDPPPDAAEMSPPYTDGTTARQWSEARQTIGSCGACHGRMDPIGFGLENFDGAGRWRDTDRGRPVDARGQLHDSDADGPFDGPIELTQKLAGSKQVQGCLATQWFRYGTGRRETDRDACNLSRLQQAFARSNGDIRQLLIDFTQTDTFLSRSKGDQP